MDHITFKISDDQKYSMIWELLNPNFTAEGNWTVDYCILDVYDDYALCFKPEDGSYERVYYSKNDETDSLEITNHIKVFVMDITEEEKNTVETLRKLNGDTYELVSENLLHADENAENCATLNSKVEEFTTLNATLTSEKENLQNQVEELNTQYSNATAQISTLTEENAALTTYKTTIETQQKEAVITEYNDKLSTEILESYRAKMDQYTCEELDMHLAYELKKASPSVFSKNGEDGEVYLPKAAPLSGVEQILSRYAKK